MRLILHPLGRLLFAFLLIQIQGSPLGRLDDSSLSCRMQQEIDRGARWITHCPWPCTSAVRGQPFTGHEPGMRNEDLSQLEKAI